MHPKTTGDISMILRTMVASTLLFFSAAVDVSAAEPNKRELDFFETKIRPVLVAKCYQCHSVRAAAKKKLKGRLLLDSRDGLLKGGDSGSAIVPGKPGESLLIEALKYDGLQMPPQGKLPASVVADFERWIRQGAVDPRTAAGTTAVESIDFAEAAEFWAFQKPVAQPAPLVKNQRWIKNDIDNFVLARLETSGLTPSPPADRRTLIRRATFDLIGLPPTPAEIEQFVNDGSPDAYGKVLNRLLQSPHYGQRWGRHWLDVARYGEDQAHTFKARKYPRGYLYRDWVVQALNNDMPYDRFITYQLAGDLVDEPNRHERLAALGFFALGPVYYQDNGEKAKALADEWDDRLDTLTRGVLGLTASCARCHDHKFDPIRMADYYALAGIFASTKYQEQPAVAEEVVQQRRAADDAAKKQQLDIDRFLAAEARSLRITLIDEIPAYMTAAFKAINRRKVDKDKKLVDKIAKQERVSPLLLKRWVAYLSDTSSKQRPWLDAWRTLHEASDKSKDSSADNAALEKVREVALVLQSTVLQKTAQKDVLFKQYGENAAFLAVADRANVPAGVIPLGNLFDDAKGVSLQAAIASDRFKATASTDRLGVSHVKNGWGAETDIAPGVRFHFGKLGSDKSAYGSVTNDAWNTNGGIRTRGAQFNAGSKRTEQGIGMHANALVTFDLDEIRRAGLLPADQKFVLKIDRAGLNDDVFGSRSSSAHLAVIVTKPHDKRAVYDAVLAGYVNGRKMTINENDKVYYFGGEIPDPMKADGRFVSFTVAIPPEAKHLTLVTTGANHPDDNPINSDHAVFSGARLEMDPLPKTTETANNDTPENNAGEQKLDRLDAVLLSRMFYDEGLLALPAKEAERHLPDAAKTRLKQIRDEQQKFKKAAEAIVVTMAHSLTEGASADLKIYLRGDPTNQGEIAPRAMPAIFTGGKTLAFESSGSGRLELARAIVLPENPLTARVIVNRVWAGHFGAGLVRTTSNFGKLGERPTHPKLLDYLAARFMQQGWSLKTLHREIMQSAAYRQAGSFDAAKYEADPENRLLWRMNRRRLEIEPWRDALLSVSGELDGKMGGPSADLTSADNKRRTIYGFVSRHRLNELLRLFDFPDPNITSAQRNITTVPLQQLFVLNSDFMMQRAKALAERLQRDVSGDDKEKVKRAYLLLFGRAADEQEIRQGVEFVGGQKADSDGLSPWQQYALALLSANEFMFVD